MNTENNYAKNLILVQLNFRQSFVSRESWIKKCAHGDYFYELPSKALLKEKEFYVEHAKFLRDTDGDTHSLSNILRAAPCQFMKDKRLAGQLVSLVPNAIYYFSEAVKREKEVILSFMEGCSTQPYYKYPGLFGYLRAENRITVAYEVCKTYPQYQDRFGAGLRRKLNGMDIVKYVETRALYKKLEKEVPKKSETTRRLKI